jgi:predicted transposase YdaD
VATGTENAAAMKTDKQIHALLASSPEAFRFLTDGIELNGPYQGRSVVFKDLERRADHVFEPDDGKGPTYLIEVQAQHTGDVYDRLLMELLLYRRAHPERTVYGQVIFLHAGCDEPNWPWAEWVGRGPLRKAVYLDQVLEKARQQHPDHPLLAVFLPWFARDVELAQQAPAAWRRLEALAEPGAAVLLDVFMSWMMERFKGQTYEEVLRMLQVLTPLEETRAYKELVGKGEKLGRQKATLELLTKLLHRRFGRLPRWANDRLRQADLKQLEAWAENIFDAKELTDLLGPKPN